MKLFRTEAMKTKRLIAALSFLALAGILFSADAQQPVPQERITALKQSIQQSHNKLKRYEWIETTTVMLKGDIKSQKQKRCYFGADGKVQKVEIASTAAAPPSGGRLKRRIVANKKEELTDYMQKAVALIHRYVPLDPGQLQAAKDAGKATFGVMEPNKVIQVDLKDIIQQADLTSATFDIQKNEMLEVDVSTYLESQKDAILLKVLFSHLPDGTSYAGQTTLEAKAKDIKVVVANSGHRQVN